MRIFSFLQEKVLVLAENDLVENLRRLLCSQSLLLDGKREPKCADMFPWAVFFMITGNYFARKVLAQGRIGENENILVVGGDFSSAAVPVPEHQRGRTWHFRASSFRLSDERWSDTRSTLFQCPMADKMANFGWSYGWAFSKPRNIPVSFAVYSPVLWQNACVTKGHTS